MIAEFGNDDTRPKVARFQGKVAVYAVDDGDNHGFLLPAAAATDTAVRILAAVNDLAPDAGFAHEIDGMKFQVISATGQDPEGLLTFQFGGAPVRATLTSVQIAELAAGFAAALRSIDRPTDTPRPDR